MEKVSLSPEFILQIMSIDKEKQRELFSFFWTLHNVDLIMSVFPKFSLIL